MSCRPQTGTLHPTGKGALQETLRGGPRSVLKSLSSGEDGALAARLHWEDGTRCLGFRGKGFRLDS